MTLTRTFGMIKASSDTVRKTKRKNKSSSSASRKPFPHFLCRSVKISRKCFFSRMKEIQGSHTELFPDVLETLTALSPSYSLAIISNGNKDLLQSNLTRLNLSEFFSRTKHFHIDKRGIQKSRTRPYFSML